MPVISMKHLLEAGVHFGHQSLHQEMESILSIYKKHQKRLIMHSHLSKNQ